MKSDCSMQDWYDFGDTSVYFRPPITHGENFLERQINNSSRLTGMQEEERWGPPRSNRWAKMQVMLDS